MNYKKPLIFLLAVTMCGQANGQDNPLAPWISSDMGNINVNTGNILQKDLAHGTANVTIPFYSYTNSGIDLGVSISYNTQPIQVDREASNVGLGWEMNCGGYIQRETRDFPDDVFIDETINVGFPVRNRKYGYWFQKNGNNYDCLVNRCDEESDIFYAVFGNRTIKFTFSRDGELLTIPKSNIKIERLNEDVPLDVSLANQYLGATTGFLITDESGNKFYYTRTFRIERSFTHFEPAAVTAYYPISKWVLDKVVTYEGELIDYHYSPGENVQVHLHEPQGVRIQQSGHWYPPVNANDMKTVERTRLLKITYPNNTEVEFNYLSSPKRCDADNDLMLNGITIRETVAAGIYPKASVKYVFSHGYFVSPDAYTAIFSSSNNSIPMSSCTAWTISDSYKRRLKLSGISYQSMGGPLKNYYSFEYSNMALPMRVFGSRDKYGRANQYTIPNVLCTEDNTYYDLRISHGTLGANFGVSGTSYLEACMLKKVVNASKGEIEFVYTSTTQFDGFMVDQIKLFDGYNHDNDVISKYTYGQVHGWNASPVSYEILINDGGDPSNYNSRWNALSSTATLNTGLNGSSFVFREVTEEVKDRNNTLLKKNAYKFSGLSYESEFNDGNSQNMQNSNDFGISYANNTNLFFDDPPYSNKQYVRDWAVGLPLSIEYYDGNNQLLRKEKFKYTVTHEHMSSKPAFLNTAKLPKKIELQNDVTALEYYTDLYYPFTGETLLTEKTTEDYVSSTQFMASTTTNTYDDEGNLEEQSTTNSRSQPITQKYLYNYSVWQSTLDVPALQKMHADDIQRLLYTETYKNGKLVASTVPSFNHLGGNIIRPHRQYILAAPVALSTPTLDLEAVNDGFSVANYRHTGTITKHSSKGYPLEQTDGSGLKYSASIWDEVTGTTLASAVNAQYNDIAYCGFESEYDVSGAVIQWGNWEFEKNGIVTNDKMLGRKAYRLTDTTTLWSKPGSLQPGKEYFVSFWSKDTLQIGVNFGINTSEGAITLYKIDEYNGWHLYKGKFQLSGYGNVGIWAHNTLLDELRIYPVKAEMTNVNITPLLGKTSEIDANDRIITYEYDGWGRLSVTKDMNGDIITKTEHVVQGND